LSSQTKNIFSKPFTAKLKFFIDSDFSGKKQKIPASRRVLFGWLPIKVTEHLSNEHH